MLEVLFSEIYITNWFRMFKPKNPDFKVEVDGSNTLFYDIEGLKKPLYFTLFKKTNNIQIMIQILALPEKINEILNFTNIVKCSKIFYYFNFNASVSFQKFKIKSIQFKNLIINNEEDHSIWEFKFTKMRIK